MNFKNNGSDINIGKYKAIFNSIPIPTYVWHFEKNGIILTDFNQAARLITEGKIKNYLRLGLSDLYDENYEVYQDIKKSFNEKLSFSKEMLYKFKSTGKERVLYVTYIFLEPQYVIVYTEDITKQKQAEELLKKAEREKSIILESLSEHIVYQDLDHNVIWTNKAAADSVELTIEQLIGKKCHKIWNGREERCPGCPVYAAVKSCKPSKGEMTTEDGRIWLVKGYPVLDEKGNVVAAVEITNEITNIKEAEEKLKDSELQYRNTINSMADAIHVVDKDLRILLFNPATIDWLSFLGFEINILGKKINVAFPFLPEKVLNEYKRVLDSGKSLITEEETIIDGKIYFTESRKIPVLIDGQIAQIITIVRDISKRKISERKLKESEKKYREAYNRSNFYKDLFAHDINNIFQNIQSSTELLTLVLDELKIDKGSEYLDIIKDQIIRGSNLVSNVRKLSDIEEIESHLRKIEIIEILNDVKKFIIKSFHNKNIKIDIQSESEKIFCNANELILDVIENILFNAIRYNKNPIINIIIKVYKEKIGLKSHIRIEFLDNGIGIPDEMKKKVFQRGYNHKGIIKGLGLGLTLVKKIIELYHGEIWVEDKVPGDYTQGSKFIISIPEVD